MISTNLYMFRHRSAIYREITNTKGSLPEDGTYEMPKHVEDCVSSSHFSACNVGVIN